MSTRVLGIISGALLLCVLAVSEARGLGASPAAAVMQNVPVGEELDTGQDIIINNDNEAEMEVRVDVIKPIMPSHESLQGYTPVSDLSFIYTDAKTIMLPAKGKSKTRLHIKVPNEDRYYNQNWAVSVRIAPTGRQFMRTAVAPFFILETVAKQSINGKPEGSMGFVPNALDVKRDDLKKNNMLLKLFNNTTEERKYSIKAYVPDNEPDRFMVQKTAWFDWLLDLKQVRVVNSEVQIGSAQEKNIEIQVMLPDELQAVEDRNGWEVLIIAESDKKEKRFARLRILN